MTKYGILGAKNHFFWKFWQIFIKKLAHMSLKMTLKSKFSKRTVLFFIRLVFLSVNLPKDHFKIHLKALKHFLLPILSHFPSKKWIFVGIKMSSKMALKSKFLKVTVPIFHKNDLFRCHFIQVSL